MFFRKKKNAEAETTTAAETPVEGTAPGVVEASSTETVGSMAAEETVSASVVAPEGEAAVPATTEDAVRLFPGFERDDFEVGFRADQGQPALMMRWKDGGEWFSVPAMFNRGVLAAMDERESSSDLNRLLRNYGYDIDAVS